MAGTVVAIHQPNLAPRLSTLAKLYAADIWIVLDDVQFNARDYQHRARLADLDNPERQRWLSIPTHRPHGRSTLIRDVRVADARIARRRLELLTAQHYRRAPGWPNVGAVVDATLDALRTTNQLAAIAEASTRALLTLLGWHGTIHHSHTFAVGAERSARLADLTAAVHGSTYLTGTGGARYLSTEPFEHHALAIEIFTPPSSHGPWPAARRLSALHATAQLGARLLRTRIADVRPATMSPPRA